MKQKADRNRSFASLKHILLEAERKRLDNLELRLDDPIVRAREISRVLPEAVSFSTLENDRLAQALQPAVDDSLKASVKKNPSAIAEAIFPALGPGLRKAVTSTIRSMVQSLNHILNRSFSVQGLKWRIEALRTHRPFAEVVLFHTLLYQVEQIFLIHSDSGVVLAHVQDVNITAQDPDLVSGMLTAIQDFVRDSFHSDNASDDIETLRIGSDRSVWIEKGEHAFIAAVIRGTPPLELRLRYRELIEEIHLKAGKALENFDGDILPFTIFRDQLEKGLQARKKNDADKISPLVWIAMAGLAAVAALWGFHQYRISRAWTSYLEKLETQKGLIVISSDHAGGYYNIYGLKDPMAQEPDSLVSEEARKLLDIRQYWKKFYSLDPGFVISRAQKILAPPAGIELSLAGAVLAARGRAGQKWLDRFAMLGPSIAGVDSIDAKQVNNIDKEGLAEALNRLEAVRIYFKTRTADLVRGQENSLARAVELLMQIRRFSTVLHEPVRIMIMGYTDSSGSETLNRKLSRARAEQISDFLTARGLSPCMFFVSGARPDERLVPEKTVHDRQFNRAVVFRPVL